MNDIQSILKFISERLLSSRVKKFKYSPPKGLICFYFLVVYLNYLTIYQGPLTCLPISRRSKVFI